MIRQILSMFLLLAMVSNVVAQGPPGGGTPPPTTYKTYTVHKAIITGIDYSTTPYGGLFDNARADADTKIAAAVADTVDSDSYVSGLRLQEAEETSWQGQFEVHVTRKYIWVVVSDTDSVWDPRFPVLVNPWVARIGNIAPSSTVTETIPMTCRFQGEGPAYHVPDYGTDAANLLLASASVEASFLAEMIDGVRATMRGEDDEVSGPRTGMTNKIQMSELYRTSTAAGTPYTEVTSTWDQILLSREVVMNPDGITFKSYFTASYTIKIKRKTWLEAAIQTAWDQVFNPGG